MTKLLKLWLILYLYADIPKKFAEFLKKSLTSLFQDDIIIKPLVLGF